MAGVRLCDSHGHVQMLEPGELRPVLDRAREAGVETILVPGTTLEDSRAAVEIAEREPGLFAAVGVHPHESSGFDADRDLRVFEELLGSPRAVAVGEIGLDFHYDHSPRESQLAAFEAQLDFAASRGLPVLLHNREAGEAMLAALEKRGSRPRAGVFHSFTESAAFGRRAVALGFKISYSGMLTFKSAHGIRASAQELPLSEMLVETDAPFLAPEPHRGKRCEPAFVRETADRLARLKCVELDEVARATSRNFDDLFLAGAARR